MALKSQTSTVHISNEDADITAYGTATFVKISEVTNIGAPSGEAADIDVTHLESAAKEYLVGVPDEGNIELAMNAVDADPGQLELIDAKDTQQRRWIKITWSNGEVWYAKGLVKKYTWSAGVDSKIEAASSIRTSGAWVRV